MDVPLFLSRVWEGEGALNEVLSRYVLFDIGMATSGTIVSEPRENGKAFPEELWRSQQAVQMIAATTFSLQIFTAWRLPYTETPMEIKWPPCSAEHNTRPLCSQTELVALSPSESLAYPIPTFLCVYVFFITLLPQSGPSQEPRKDETRRHELSTCEPGSLWGR